MSATTTDETPPEQTAAPRRRFGAVGLFAVVALAVCAVFGFVRYTNRQAPARQCRGSAALVAPGSGFESADAAIAGFARQPRFARWQKTVSSVPADGWLRRTTNVYEREVDDGQTLILDVGETSEGWAVSGFWVCTAVGV